MTSRDGPLLAAIAAARADDVGALLDAGANPNAYERPHRALHRAVLRKQIAIVRRLLDAGADVDARSDYHERTALHYAAHDEGACLSRLLDRGASVDAVDHQGWTPLMFAAMANDAAAVTMLVRHGARVDLRSSAGRSAVAIAAAELAVATVQTLLALDADADAADDRGWTALHATIAALADHGADGVPAAQTIVGALLDHGASPQRATSEAVVFRDDELPAGTTPAGLLARLPLRKGMRELLAARLLR